MSLFDPKKLMTLISGVKAISIFIGIASMLVVLTPTKQDDIFMERVRHAWNSVLDRLETLTGHSFKSDEKTAEDTEEIKN